MKLNFLSVRCVRYDRRFLLFKCAPLLIALNLFCSAMVRIAYCDDWWQQFQDSLNQAQDWFKEKSNEAQNWWNQKSREAQDWWDQANQWAQEKSKEAQQWWNEKSREASEWWEQSKQWGQDLWNKAGEWSEQAKQQIEQFSKEFEQKVKQNFEQAVEFANSLTGAYREEAFNILEKEARRQLCEKYSDPAEVGELEKRRDLLTEATIAAVKLIPIYDPESGQIHTFDQFARNLYSEIPGVEGSDLAKDPVRCVALMVLDNDYLMYAKIIQTPDGKWISMAEALSIGYKVNEVTSAISDYRLAQEGFVKSDSTKVNEAMTSFVSRINKINEGAKTSTMNLDPMFLTPFGLITAGAIAFLGIHKKRATLKS